MKNAFGTISFALLFTSFAAGSPHSENFETIPVSDIRPGMVGEGRTVFSGSTIESFKVTILGVLRNYGPNQNMILAELEAGLWPIRASSQG